MVNLISVKFYLQYMPAFAEDYDLLGLEPGANRSEIKMAFRNLARVYHSDRYHGKDADEMFREVHAAYQRLLAGLDAGGNPVAANAGVEGADAETYYSEKPEAYAPPQDPSESINISAVHHDALDLSILGEFNVDAYVSAFNENSQRSLLSSKPDESMNLFFFLMLPMLAFDCSFTQVQHSRGQRRYRRSMHRIFLNALTAGMLCSEGQNRFGLRTVQDFAPYYPHVGDDCFDFQIPFTRAAPNSHSLTVLLESTLKPDEMFHYIRNHLVGYLSMEMVGTHYLPVGYCRFQDTGGFYRDMFYHPRFSPEGLNMLCPLDQSFMDNIISEFFAI